MRIRNDLILNFNIHLVVLTFVVIIMRHPKSKNVFEKHIFSGCFVKIEGGAFVGIDRMIIFLF
jgi:hypothetical protein